MLEDVKQYVFKLCLLLFAAFNWFILKFIHKQQNDSYENSASVYKILFRHKATHKASRLNTDIFLYIHSEHTHPNVVLDDNISLFHITKDEAIFVDCGGINVFDPKHTFVYFPQYRYASRLIVMPIESFHLIAKQIEMPTVPILHVANHGRCGSTLLSKVFEDIPDCFTVSELMAFTSIAEISRRGYVDRSKLKMLCSSIMMCMLKHSNTRNSRIVFFKGQNTVTYITDLLMEALPAVKHIYMYRQPIPFIRSYEKLFSMNRWSDASSQQCKSWSGIGYNVLLQNTPRYPYHVMNRLHFASKMSLLWITGAAAFNNLLKRGCTIKSFKYEDLVAEPKRNIQALFAYAGISEELIPDVDTVMATDSQAGTQFSSRNLQNFDLNTKKLEFTDEIRSEMNKLCLDFNVPLFWDDIHLPEKV